MKDKEKAYFKTYLNCYVTAPEPIVRMSIYGSDDIEDEIEESCIKRWFKQIKNSFK